jgi:hypothetical protein
MLRSVGYICAQAAIDDAQLRVLADKNFRTIRWKKSGMAFLCVFGVLAYSLDLDIDEPTTEAFGAFLIAELAVDMEGGFDARIQAVS